MDVDLSEVAPRIRELDRAHRFDCGLLPQMASLKLLGIRNTRETSEIQTITQVDDLLGYREDRPSGCELPAVECV
jgi:hypothetical protein